MFLKLRSRALPIVLLVFSSLWTAGAVLPLFYSLLVPDRDIQRIVRALEGRETLPEALAPLAQQVVDTAGHVKRAIQVGVYWHVEADYNIKKSHKTKKTQISYLAWFERRAEPTILIVTRREVDGAELYFNIDEGEPNYLLRFYLLPLSVLAFSIYWFRRRSSAPRDEHPPGT